jgi:Transglutaminase-like superfamily
MLPLLLASDTYFCEFDHGAIFLRLRHNNYLAVDSACVSQLKIAVSGWSSCGTAGYDVVHGRTTSSLKFVNELLELGVLTRSERDGKPATHLRIATSDSILEQYPIRAELNVTVDNLVKFMTSLAFVAFFLKTSRLKALIDRMQRVKTKQRGATPAPTTDAVVAALRFFRIRPWFYTAKDACLLDSICLTFFLLEYKLNPTFVIGVKTKPFAAHAWVQFDSHVVNDSPETVQQYSPILSV